jgi:biotin carboxylase
VFVSDRCDQLDDPWWDHAIPVRFHDLEQSVHAVRSASSEPPAGIVAVGDRPAVLAAHLARAFRLPGHPPEAAARSRNKFDTKQALRIAGLPVPWFEQVPANSNASVVSQHVPYPAVLKPAALSGSRGVTRVNDVEEFAGAFERLRRLLQVNDVRVERDPAHESIVIEAFIPGAEYAVEGILTEGTFQLIAIFDKPDPLNGPFFEETIYVTPSAASSAMQHRIAAAVAAAARALGLHHGPVHAECRVDGDTVYVLEVAARPIGGLCSRALRFDNDATLEEVLLRHAIGEDVSRYAREPLASGVMMIPIPKRGVFRRVEGVEDARRVAGVEDVQMTAKPDSIVVPLPEGKSYLGFIFARAAEPRAVEKTLRDAHNHLRFVIDREVALAR